MRRTCEESAEGTPDDSVELSGDGRRNFVEIHDRFPEECRHVIAAFKVIYHNDKVVYMEETPADARLAWHQTQGRPIMDKLHA